MPNAVNNHEPITITVEGRWPFPIDMLRYDQCAPYDSEAVSTITRFVIARGEHNNGVVRLKLNCYKRFGPTAARWSSFGWSVIENSEDVEAEAAPENFIHVDKEVDVIRVYDAQGVAEARTFDRQAYSTKHDWQLTAEVYAIRLAKKHSCPWGANY